MLKHKEITEEFINSAFEVHEGLDYGFIEKGTAIKVTRYESGQVHVVKA